MSLLLSFAQVIDRLNHSETPRPSHRDINRIALTALQWIAPNRFEVYQVEGGRIHLNLRDSFTMIKRAIGNYEIAKHRFISRCLKPGMTFLDIGSNKGEFALLAASIVGPEGRAVAVKPFPESCRWIEKSVALNGYGNVRVIERALSDHEGKSELFLGNTSDRHTLRHDIKSRQFGRVEIEVSRLDTLVETLCLDRIDLVKIDVDGAELSVLNGAMATLQRNRDLVRIMDLHLHLGADIPAIKKTLRKLGFDFYEMREPNRRLADLPRAPSEIVAAHPKVF